MDKQDKIMRNTEETWRPVKGFPLYEVSDFARIRNVLKCRIVIPFPKNGVLLISIKKNGVYNYRPLDKTVAEAFVDNRFHSRAVTHLNGDPYDCKPSNLVWKPRATKSSRPVRKMKDGRTVETYLSITECAEANRMTNTTLYHYIKLKKEHKGFIYEYMVESVRN